MPTPCAEVNKDTAGTLLNSISNPIKSNFLQIYCNDLWLMDTNPGGITRGNVVMPRIFFLHALT